jgi:hypothetical protein
MNYDETDWRPTHVKGLFKKHFILRDEAIKMRMCCACGGEAEIFADDLSARDYTITGLCQNCQNDMYSTNGEEYADTGER